MLEIFPSLISADLLNIENQIKILEPYCDGFHLDIMDYHFVPNLTLGPDFVNQIRNITDKTLQIHLMVEFPEKYLNGFKLHENDIISVHIESPSTIPFEELLHKISLLKLLPSIAINPFTPLEAVMQIKYKLRHVLLMSVNPGFSGQEFMPHTIQKLKNLNLFRKSHNLDFKIGIDGGINQNNCSILKSNGADQLVISSAIFSEKNPLEAIKKIRNLIS